MDQLQIESKLGEFFDTLRRLAREKPIEFVEAIAKLVEEVVADERKRCLAAARGDNQEGIDWHARQHRDHEDVEAVTRKMIIEEIEGKATS